MKIKVKRGDRKPVQSTTIDDAFIRLDALIKFSGNASTGGEAKQLILDRSVTVNGEICTQRGKKIRNGDTVGIRDSFLRVAAPVKPHVPEDQSSEGDPSI